MGRPNILFIMADQMAAGPLPMYGGPVLAPHMAALAARGVVFDAAYCNSPICAPSRCSMLTGRLPTAIGAWDNASELASSRPTLAHALAAAGWRTILAGKMHFIGPDQLHGYEERLTTDIYPAGFDWTPDWSAGPRDKPSGISMSNVLQAGPCLRSMQIDYDDEVEYFATQRLYDLAREPQEARKPFFMTVSFSHPHPPYTAGQEHWDRYDHGAIAMPAVPPIPVEERDMQSQWLHQSHDADRQPVSAEQVRNARHAYYAMVSYVDDKVGRLVQTLHACGLAEDTIVVVTADHGEMLGERGMWYKQNFFEPSVRVPLMVCAPGRYTPRRVAEPVSLVDLLPTFLDWAGGVLDWPEPLDGRSLVPLLTHGRDAAEATGTPGTAPRQVLSEYTDMGVIAPCRMLRVGRYKYIYTHGHPAQLYDLDEDPAELHNLASVHPPAAPSGLPEVLARMHRTLLDGWNADAVHAAVLASQRSRLFLKKAAAASGRYPDWSFQAVRDDSRRYVRASGAAGAKARARWPFVPPESTP
ncbi:MAG: choline-sulfatase [Pseudomonadota bacterium]